MGRIQSFNWQWLDTCLIKYACLPTSCIQFFLLCFYTVFGIPFSSWTSKIGKCPQYCHTLSRPNWNRFQVINSLKDLMEQGFLYEKDCLSKKERTACIGNGNSGENPKRFNRKEQEKKRKRYMLTALSFVMTDVIYLGTQYGFPGVRLQSINQLAAINATSKISTLQSSLRSPTSKYSHSPSCGTARNISQSLPAQHVQTTFEPDIRGCSSV